MSQRLEDLRVRIAAVDREIGRLAAERFALAREIGVVKREEGLPVRSFSAEAEVLGRFRALAGELGLEEHFAERLALHLIGTSVRLQEESIGGQTERAQRILIVGGAGKMGRWLAGFFAGQGHFVTILDPAGPVEGFPSAIDLPRGVGGAETVLVATPLSLGRQVLADVFSLRPAGLVVDIFSLKSHVLDLLREAAGTGLKVASLHPLFGPEVRTLSGRVLAVCDCGNPAAADEAEALFSDTALSLARLSVESHDEYMQYVLGLSHVVAILFFTTLRESGRPFDELANMASTTFHKHSRTAAEVARENPYLYYEIQKLNRHSEGLFERIRRCLEKIEAATRAGDPRAFLDLRIRNEIT